MKMNICLNSRQVCTEGILRPHRRRQAGVYKVLSSLPVPSILLTAPSRPGSEDGDGMTSVMGVMQALISVFIDDNDKLRSVNAGNTRITFLLRSPLYYVCASSWGEPEFVVRCLPSPFQLCELIREVRHGIIWSIFTFRF